MIAIAILPFKNSQTLPVKTPINFGICTKPMKESMLAWYLIESLLLNFRKSLNNCLKLYHLTLAGFLEP